MNLVKKMVIALGLAAVSVPLLADPPGHAPAHGWRKKNDPHYVGYTGRTWQDDYGIRSGRCNREAVGAAQGQRQGLPQLHPAWRGQWPQRQHEGDGLPA